MFIRRNFVTNSSSTGYVAWGVVVPKELLPYDYLPEPQNGVEVRWVSDTERAVCIEQSVDWTTTEDDDPYLIDEGVYPLQNTDGRWRATCVASVGKRDRKSVV